MQKNNIKTHYFGTHNIREEERKREIKIYRNFVDDLGPEICCCYGVCGRITKQMQKMQKTA